MLSGTSAGSPRKNDIELNNTRKKDIELGIVTSNPEVANINNSATINLLNSVPLPQPKEEPFRVQAFWLAVWMIK